MFRCVLNMMRKPPVASSALLHRRDFGRTSTKNVQFVSFLDESGFRRVDPDRYERSMRRRRVLAYSVLWLMVAGFAWVVIESAQALSIF
ncbi:hypothetical protein ASA1KI_10150 [Opitutales bacterium ASA1]|jgi:hypothetical protein|uniref:hypothetical protein n=1 Tax=Congregicoccus parvus TaxID=3081749 RepID=UPI002B30EAE5|nr:hypothetical protein ASA1KI_10150 [Opitutales bacterium ASA1]